MEVHGPPVLASSEGHTLPRLGLMEGCLGTTGGMMKGSRVETPKEVGFLSGLAQRDPPRTASSVHQGVSSSGDSRPQPSCVTSAGASLTSERFSGCASASVSVIEKRVRPNGRSPGRAPGPRPTAALPCPTSRPPALPACWAVVPDQLRVAHGGSWASAELSQPSPGPRRASLKGALNLVGCQQFKSTWHKVLAPPFLIMWTRNPC